MKIDTLKPKNNLTIITPTSSNINNDSKSISHDDIYNKNSKDVTYWNNSPIPIARTSTSPSSLPLVPKPKPALPTPVPVPLILPTQTSVAVAVAAAPTLIPNTTQVRKPTDHVKPIWDPLNGTDPSLVSLTLPKDFVFAQPTVFPSRDPKK